MIAERSAVVTSGTGLVESDHFLGRMSCGDHGWFFPKSDLDWN
jgi:hypothetical protein